MEQSSCCSTETRDAHFQETTEGLSVPHPCAGEQKEHSPLHLRRLDYGPYGWLAGLSRGLGLLMALWWLMADSHGLRVKTRKLTGAN